MIAVCGDRWQLKYSMDETSPLYRWGPEDLVNEQTEFLVLVKSFDDTFSQVVHSRYSYPHGDIVWGAKFVQAFHVDESGDMVLEVDLLDEIQRVELPGVAQGAG